MFAEQIGMSLVDVGRMRISEYVAFAREAEDIRQEKQKELEEAQKTPNV